MLKNKYFVLVFLSVFLLLVRLPVLCTSISTLYHESELYTGTIAKQLIEGRILPIFDYQAYHNRGGSLVVGILTIPFFLLFGQSYFSLKLLALSFSLATFVLWYLFLARFFNKRVALLAGLFFILSPPFYTKFTLMNYGKHTESNLFTIMAIFIFFTLFFKNESFSHSPNSSQEPEDMHANKKIYYAFFGLVSGFGMYFDYIFFITLFTCFVFWFIFDKRFILRKSFLVFLVFFLIGLSPWIYYNVTHGLKGVCLDDIEPSPALSLRELSFPHTPLALLNKLAMLLSNHLPNSFCFENFRNIPGYFISHAFYCIFILSFLLLSWFNRKIILQLILRIVSPKRPLIPLKLMTREVFILAYPIILLLLYGLGPYKVKVIKYQSLNFYDYKRLIVMYPFIFVIISLSLDKLWSWKNKNKIFAFLSILLILFLTLSGLAANYGLINMNNFSNCLTYEGYSYYMMGDIIAKRSGEDILKAVSLTNKLDKSCRAFAFQAIGSYWGSSLYQRPGGIDICIARINTIEPEYRPYALQGLGVLIGWKFKDDISRIHYYMAHIDKAYKPYLYRGAGAAIGLEFEGVMDECVKKINMLDEKYRPDCYQGFGEVIARRFGQNIPQCVEFLDSVKPEYQTYAYTGLGRSLMWRYTYYLKKPTVELLEKIPEKYRVVFVKGLVE